MTRQMFWLLVKRYAARAGILHPVTPHTLRHAFGHPPPQPRRGPAGHSAPSRTPRDLHHPDLHPRRPRAAADPARRASPAGLSPRALRIDPFRQGRVGLPCRYAGPHVSPVFAARAPRRRSGALRRRSAAQTPGRRCSFNDWENRDGTRLLHDAAASYRPRLPHHPQGGRGMPSFTPTGSGIPRPGWASTIRRRSSRSPPAPVLSSLIPRTRQITFATGVICMPQYHPAVTAGQAAMFDHMSEGRFIMGSARADCPRTSSCSGCRTRTGTR